MQKMAFLIFYTIVITVYLLINYYIYSRGVMAIPEVSTLRSLFPWIFWGLASTYILGRTLERIYLSHLSDALVWIGSFWLAAMLYFFLIAVLADLIRVAQHYLPFLPERILQNLQTFKLTIFYISVSVVAVALIAGHINTLHPVVRKVSIHIEKDANGMNELNAVLLSDIHLGTLIGNGHLKRIVDKVMALEPDIIFLAGDMLDEDLEPVLRQNIGATLQELSAPMGVIGVMGNHEYIGGAEPAYEYLKSHGIIMLRDSVMKVNDSFYVIGREDRDKPRFSDRKRLPLERLVSETNKNFPVILIDHQPYYIEEAAELGVDLQLSGHTHDGQLWPLNWITSAIFTISRGYGRIGDLHVYVSNGVGTWGPPVRIGNRPEIVKLEVKFGK